MNLRDEEAVVHGRWEEHVRNVVEGIEGEHRIEKVYYGLRLLGQFTRDVGAAGSESEKLHLARGINDNHVRLEAFNFSSKPFRLFRDKISRHH